MIEADGRRLWRVLENLYNNAFKYALEGTRVYVTIEDHGADVVFTIKNVSANPLNISPDELTERFVRGDVSRTTEGSGLGLSIAKDLTTLQGGKFELIIDGDLFKAQITFPIKNYISYVLKSLRSSAQTKPASRSSEYTGRSGCTRLRSGPRHQLRRDRQGPGYPERTPRFHRCRRPQTDGKT